MARKTKAEARATRDRILDAAEVMFCVRGAARTSLHEIAESVEMTRGAVYWHFKDKYDLLLALWERAKLPIEEALDAIDAEVELSPLQRIKKKVMGLFHRIVHDERTRNLLTILLLRCEMVDEVAAAREHILGQRDECLDKLVGEFAAAIQCGELRDDVEPRAAAIGLHAIVDGLAYHWLLDASRFDLEVVGGSTLEGWLTGLGSMDRVGG
ncbi:MAG: TetR family transcriptional regulator [Planctomycetes bacterium]|nr:TetR family transcriptional regulator [Planctomycetota bacterium]